MDALRNSKKISLLAVAILFLFTFFNLILDAPRIRATLLTYSNLFHINSYIQLNIYMAYKKNYL
jgi:hypothetical protein